MANENDIISDYLKELMFINIPLLTLAEEKELAELIAQGDDDALEKLVKHNLRFVISTASKTTYWQHSKLPVEDIVGIGNEMLLMAAKRWKPIKNIRFSAFARPFIIRGVQRELDNTANIIRLPINITEAIKRMNYNERVLFQILGRKPTTSEIAKVLGISEAKVHQLKGYISREPVSLDSLEQERYQEENDE